MPVVEITSKIVEISLHSNYLKFVYYIMSLQSKQKDSVPQLV